MAMTLFKQALCILIVFAVTILGFEFFLYLSKIIPTASWFITWAGGITSCVVGIFVGMAAWRGFGLKEY
ncbi:hypothetical protein [Leclercia adecarboxylata]|uniref:hypothetical protein n=1 Tax=Leclercia adecarboxylata TaxID=83655 RepID=UPI00301AFD4E